MLNDGDFNRDGDNLDLTGTLYLRANGELDAPAMVCNGHCGVLQHPHQARHVLFRVVVPMNEVKSLSRLCKMINSTVELRKNRCEASRKENGQRELQQKDDQRYCSQLRAAV